MLNAHQWETVWTKWVKWVQYMGDFSIMHGFVRHEMKVFYFIMLSMCFTWSWFHSVKLRIPSLFSFPEGISSWDVQRAPPPSPRCAAAAPPPPLPAARAGCWPPGPGMTPPLAPPRRKLVPCVHFIPALIPSILRISVSAWSDSPPPFLAGP